MRAALLTSLLLGAVSAIPGVYMNATTSVDDQPSANTSMSIDNQPMRPPPGTFKLRGMRNRPEDAFVGQPPTSGGASNPQESGSGCLAGSTTALVSEDGATLTVLFDNFQTQLGKGTQKEDHRKFCKIELDVDVPLGYTFAVNNIRWQGYMHLDKGVTANFHSKYYYSDVKRAASMTRDERGPLTQNYVLNDDANGKKAFMPCAGIKENNFNIDTTISMHYGTRDSSGTGLFTVDSLDGKMKQVFALDWDKCRGK